MTDPTQQGQPSEEEIRAYLEQIREADPAAIVVQAYRMLGEGAEVKLGRSDARVLIDCMAAIAETAQASVAEELVEQMRQGVQQLQTAQVQAEREQGGEAGQPAGEQAAQQPGSQGAQPPPQGPGTAAPGQAPAGGQPRYSEPTDPKPSDRLWIPGREPGR